MHIGLGLSLTGQLRGGASIFSPATLFANDEPGIWYDPSDLTTLFQDTAGTTPVTAAGQTVALMLDKSHGLVEGPELRGSGAVGLAGAATAATYDTVTGDAEITRVNADNQSFVSFPVLANTWYTFDVTVTGLISILLREGFNSPILGTFTVGTSIKTFFTGSNTSLVFALNAADQSSGSTTFTVNSIKSLVGNHATQATAAARPTYQTDGTLHWLSFDGVDDSMVTPTITPGTDKVQVFFGVRKLSDATTGFLLEGGDVGSFNRVALLAPSLSGANSYRFLNKGSIDDVGVGTGVFAPAPDTSVITLIGDRTTPTTTIRRNGSVVETSGDNPGAGNYEGLIYYYGAREGTSLFFEGNSYSLVVRFGDNLNDSKISNAETYVANKTGLTL